MPCIQDSTHLPWLLSLSFKEFESTSKLPNFPSAVSCFSGAMASLAVRLVLNVSLNSAIMLPFLYELEKKWIPSQKIKAPVCMYPGYSWKRKFRFSAFNNTRPHARSVFDRIPYRACVMLVVNDWCMTSSWWKTSVFVRPHITRSWEGNLRYGGRKRRLHVDEKKISVFKKISGRFWRGLSISLNRELFERYF